MLTSFEGVLEGVGVVNLESLLGPAGETALVLVEADIKDLLLIGHHFPKSCPFKIFYIIISIAPSLLFHSTT